MAGIRKHLTASALAIVMPAAAAAADPAPAPAPAAAQSAEAHSATAVGGIWERDHLTGNWGGVRSRLEGWGVDLQGLAINDFLGSVSGGLRRGAFLEGYFKATVAADLEKAIGWTGSSFYFSAYELYRNVRSTEYVGNLLTVSDIEGSHGLRLYETWAQQKLWHDRVSIRVGLEGPTDEFIDSDHADLFINSTFGYPALISTNLPGGGPTSLIAHPEFRVWLQARLTDNLTFLSAIARGPGPTDEPASQPNTVFTISELQYALNHGEGGGLAGTYKLGGWFFSGPGPSLGLGSLDLPEASIAGLFPPRSNGSAFYLVADQMVWRKPHGASDQGVGVFARLIVAPETRPILSLYVDGGINWKGPFASRPDDTAGLAVAYAKTGRAARAAIGDALALAGLPHSVPAGETVIEATYLVQAAPWLGIQPDVQYVIHPSGVIGDLLGHVHEPSPPNALVVGVRSTIRF
jgi:porin